MTDNEFTAIKVDLVLADDAPPEVVKELLKRAERHRLNMAQLVCVEATMGLPRTVKMPCGHEFTVNTIEDIPQGDTDCPCGDPGHWLFRFAVSAMPEDPGDEIPSP